MKNCILICFILGGLLGCSGDPLSRVECKELLIKSTEIYANYNKQFQSELDRVNSLTDEEFNIEMGEQLDKCEMHWNKKHYKCVLEAKNLGELSRCKLEINE